MLNTFHCSEEKKSRLKREREKYDSYLDVWRATYKMHCVSLFQIYLCELFGVRSVRMCYYYYCLFHISFPVVTTDPIEWIELNNTNKCKSHSYLRRSTVEKSCYLNRNCFSLYSVCFMPQKKNNFLHWHCIVIENSGSKMRNNNNQSLKVPFQEYGRKLESKMIQWW